MDDNSISTKKASREEIFTNYTGKIFFYYYLKDNQTFTVLILGYVEYAISEEGADKLWELSEKLTSL